MAINKKGNHWIVDWSVPAPNGKYRRNRERFETKREAQEFVDSGYVRKVFGFSFQEKAKEFLECCCIDVQDSTLKRRTGILKKVNNFLVLNFSIAGLNAVTPPMISSYLKQEKKRGIKNTTINYDLKVLRLFFSYCVDMNYLETNPAKKVKSLSDDTSKRKSWSKKQVRAFLDSVKDEELKDIFNFLYLTGTRPVMACRVLWKHVDFENEEIFFYHSKGDGGVRTQTFPLAGELLDLLKRRYSEARKKFQHGNDIPLFPGRNLKQRCPSSLGNKATNYLNKLREVDPSFKDLQLYGLRNTFINEMIKANIQLDYVKELVGHAKLSTTEKYMTSDSEDIKKAYLDFRSK